MDSKHERSLFPESRDSARGYLALFKDALASGEEGPMTGEELRLYGRELELKKSDSKQAQAVRELRLKKRENAAEEMRQYFANLRRRMK